MARKWWTLTAVVVGMFMLLLDVTIVNVALPQIQKAFGASLPELQWIIDAYALTLAALMLTAGALADRFGGAPRSPSGRRSSRPGRCCAGWRPARWTSRCHGPGRASAARSCSPPRSHCSATRSGARTAGRVRRLRRGHRDRRRDRAGHRRRDHQRPVVAVDLPGERPDRHRHHRRHPGQSRGSRDPEAARPDWLGFASFSTALALLVYGLISRRRMGIGQGGRQPGRLGRAACRLRDHRADPAAADA